MASGTAFVVAVAAVYAVCQCGAIDIAPKCMTALGTALEADFGLMKTASSFLTNRAAKDKMEEINLKLLIHTLKQCSGAGGMEENEYFEVMNYVRKNAPLNMLVWGLGFDSLVLNRLNQGGKTTFLEPSAEWVGIVKQTKEGKNLNIVHYNESSFRTRVDTYEAFKKAPHRADSIPLLDANRCYDLVLIDSPNGHIDSSPSRAVPIFTAMTDAEQCIKDGKNAAHKEVSVWVHDCIRPLEDDATMRYLKKSRMSAEIGTGRQESHEADEAAGHAKLRKFSFKAKSA